MNILATRRELTLNTYRKPELPAVLESYDKEYGEHRAGTQGCHQ